MTNGDWKVGNVSVVILAQSHNPSVINPDFLKNNGIVDAGWDAVPPLVTTPVVAQIGYENVSWEVTPERCVVSEKVNAEFRDSYYLYECAKRYVDVLRHIPYTALGLNWQILLTLSADPNDWLKSKFLKDESWKDEILTADLTLKLRSGDSSICSLAMKVPNASDQNLVIVDCNFHFDFQSEARKSEKIVAILSEPMSYQDILGGYLNKYFMERGETA